MREIPSRVLISSGAAISIGGAAAFWTLQASAGTEGLWPLPALALLDWGVLGFAGFLTAGLGGNTGAGEAAVGPWVIGGALLPLGVIGRLSIGPFVLLSAACFVGGAVWARLRRARLTRRDLRWLLGGMLGNLLFLLLVIALG